MERIKEKDISSPIITHIVEQHAENAAFLWLLRDAAVREPHFKLKDVSKLDGRLEANLDGLRIAGEPGWDICLQALQMEEPGEVFTAGVLALESLSGKRLDPVLGIATNNSDNFRALVSATGWLNTDNIRWWLESLWPANNLAYKRLAVAACDIHRIHLADALLDLIKLDDLYIQCRALRMAGNMKRGDFLTILKDYAHSDETSLRFWAAWSAGLMQQNWANAILQKSVEDNGAYAEAALQILLRVWDSRSAQPWLKQLASEATMRRWVIKGTGIAGDPIIIPWLLEQMKTEYHARVAGEAFSMITGVDLAYDDLEGDYPEDFHMGPSEDAEDEDVSLDEDEDLPWPAVELIQAWWAKNRQRFTSGKRYLCGAVINHQQCKQVLQVGFQRQRQAAALELALVNREQILLNTHAPGFEQEKPGGLERQISLSPEPIKC